MAVGSSKSGSNVPDPIAIAIAIALPINALQLGEDVDDRGDGGRVAVVDDQSRSRRPRTRVLGKIQGTIVQTLDSRMQPSQGW